MSFSLSVITTLLISGLVWLGVLFQPVTESSIFEKYASYNLSAEQTSEAAYSMITYGREETSKYFKLDDPTLRSNVAMQDAPKLQESRAAEPLQLAAIETSKPKKTNKAAKSPPQIVGISRTINLGGIEKLWQDFEAKTELSKQISSENYTIYVVYSDLNADYSRAKVSIGFLDAAMTGPKFSLPAGKKASLLASGKHTANDIYESWNKIDYNKSVKAVLERHDYNGTAEKISVSVIYQ